ncbi:MAG: site-specific integrase [Nanoarchaeota archaeon]|nr:site-specific integrase [Nanoarchaeota archaeon]
MNGIAGTFIERRLFTKQQNPALEVSHAAGEVQMKNKWILDETKCLRREEVSRLRTILKQRLEANGDLHGYLELNDWFLVELGLLTGMRVEEMTKYRPRDFNVAGKNTVLIRGKGSKNRIIMVSEVFRRNMTRFLRIKKSLCNLEHDPDESVFQNPRTSRPYSTRGLQKAFKRCLRLADLPLHYSIHCLRHTYATFLLLSSNRNYELVSRQLGHASIRTTQVYSHILPGETEKALKNLYR